MLRYEGGTMRTRVKDITVAALVVREMNRLVKMIFLSAKKLFNFFRKLLP